MVLQDREEYIKEANRILSDEEYYSTISHNPSEEYLKEYLDLIHSAFTNNIITDKEKTFLITKNPKTAIYYHLPKIHKNSTHPLGRPIISSINSISSTLSKYIDLFLQKYVISLDSHLKDSAVLILLLKDIVWLET